MNSPKVQNVNLDQYTLESAYEGECEVPYQLITSFFKTNPNDAKKTDLISNSDVMSQLVTKERDILSQISILFYKLIPYIDKDHSEESIIPEEPDKIQNMRQIKKIGTIVFQKDKRIQQQEIKVQGSQQQKLKPNIITELPYYYITPLVESFTTSESSLSELQKIFNLHYSQTLSQIQQKSSFLPGPVQKSKLIFLPPQKYKSKLVHKIYYYIGKTLILDLDETLVHCNENLSQQADFFLTISIQFGLTIKAGVRVRPYLMDFLKQMSQIYEIIVFTASHRKQIYAEAVLNKLDPHGNYIQFLFTRENCVQDKGCYVKDLRVIQGRSQNDLIIVDNSTMSFIYQLENGVPIIPFYSNQYDQELLTLSKFLKQLSTYSNTTQMLLKYFKFNELLQYEDAKQAALDLFQELIQ